MPIPSFPIITMSTTFLSHQDAIQHWLVQRFAQLAEVPAQSIEVERPFADYQLDSAVAVTVSRELSEQLGRDLPITLFWEYPTIAALSAALVQPA
ncbi:8-amino-7-oxononanoate synthase (plasmid) [Burkholderia gladioli]